MAGSGLVFTGLPEVRWYPLAKPPIIDLVRFISHMNQLWLLQAENLWTAAWTALSQLKLGGGWVLFLLPLVLLVRSPGFLYLQAIVLYTMDKVPVQVDGRFRLGDVLGAGLYGVLSWLLTTCWLWHLDPISCRVSCTEYHKGWCSCCQTWTHHPLIFCAVRIQHFETPWRRCWYSPCPLVW
jgi:hypothetical protein